MKKEYFTLEKDLVLKALSDEVTDMEQAEKICNMLVELSKQCEDERRTRQMEGIKRARESGVALGRPRLQMPDNFEELLEEWENGIIKADMAARACGMGISTFYRRVRKYKDEKNLELNKQEA